MTLDDEIKSFLSDRISEETAQFRQQLAESRVREYLLSAGAGEREAELLAPTLTRDPRFKISDSGIEAAPGAAELKAQYPDFFKAAIAQEQQRNWDEAMKRSPVENATRARAKQRGEG